MRQPNVASLLRMRRSGSPKSAFYPSADAEASGGFEGIVSVKLAVMAEPLLVDRHPQSRRPCLTAGLRRALTDEARAAYDATVASYRQTVLTAFSGSGRQSRRASHPWEEAVVQDEAVKSARQTLAVVTNQYKAGTVSYLDVIVAQAAALTNERTAIGIQGRMMTADVLLIKALGGGWEASALKSLPAEGRYK